MSSLLDFHPLMSDRVRLSIMGALASSEKPIAFNDLLEALSLTKGNLSSHMRKLEEAGFIKVVKEFVERKPRTTFECTPLGRGELKKYLVQVQQLIEQTK